MMTEKTVTYTSEDLKKLREAGKSKTNWTKINATSDADIDDTDIDEKFWDNATVVYPNTEKNISLRVPDVVLEWFKRYATEHNIKDYQSLMCSALLDYKNQKSSDKNGTYEK